MKIKKSTEKKIVVYVIIAAGLLVAVGALFLYGMKNFIELN
ncbi:hypothetical protein ACH6EH_18090 [Paenibacillus sp. JSM ZJ436]|uniref:Uncharacterized protein n=1 Tax=Paenibacillus algicola TaxID=2565926 RepID=A0A4P8XLW9_9BACL|nr:hypothetical protein [Paenibacillus algicola]QCT03423.1 hypothetical protein E6C60_2711 [Paenibacillus algicola]